MPSSRGSISPLLAACATGALVASAALIGTGSAAATTAHVWYAGPHGSGTTCSKPKPCELFHAVTGSTTGDTVILEPGTYNNGGTPYSTELDVRASTFEGEAGKPMPVIQSGPTGPLDGVEIFGGVSARYFKVEYTGRENGINANNATISQVFVTADTAAGPSFAAACQISGAVNGGYETTFTDSVCIQTGVGTAAIGAEANGATSGALLRNVTAIASNSGGTAIEVRQDGTGSTTYDVINSIAEGVSSDLEAEWLGSGSPGSAVIDTSHSAYVTTSTSASNASVVPGAGNIKKRPVFVDPAHGKLQEKSTSLTVDAGTATGVGAHELDLAGNPRDLGKAPDIGAYEHLAKPAAHPPRLVKAKKASLKLSVRVNPEGLPTTVKIKGRFHGHHVHSASVSAGSGRSTKTIKLTLHGLKAHRTYRVYAVVADRAGRTTTGTKSARTK